MLSKEFKALALTFVMALAGGGIGAYFVSLSTKIPSPDAPILTDLKPAQTLFAAGETVQAKHEDTPPPYYLVEFLDYQCPPCRAIQPRVRAVLNQYPDRVRIVVRNFPLSMHPNARNAAEAAEAAREQGKFRPMHDALLSSESLAQDKIRTLAVSIGLDLKRFDTSRASSAKRQVEKDEQVASVIGLQGTPSLLLCTPSGQVWRLRTPEQIKEIIKIP